MGALERLTVEMIERRELESLDHLQRYALAASLVDGSRVIDLGCGVGYGSGLLGQYAAMVTGVDVSAEAVAAAQAHYSSENVRFEVADAAEFLSGRFDEFDTIVAFEVVEHVKDLDGLVSALSKCAARGDRLVLSVPNSGFYGERNEFHVTDFTLESAREVFSQIGTHRMLAQYLAEGSLIADVNDDQLAATSSWVGEAEARAASHFIALYNFENAPVFSGDLQMIARPQCGRYIQELEAANKALYQTNTELWSEIHSAGFGPGRTAAYMSAAAGRAVGARNSAELHEEIDRLRETVTAMEHSVSWRVTKPLRRIKRLVKRGS